MRAREWSYRDLAHALDVSLSQAHDWATGKYKPGIDNVKLISKKLEVDIAELIA